MSKRKDSNAFLFVVVVAAIIGALTTCTIFFLRIRSRRKALLAYNEAFDYDEDFDDCDCDYCVSTEFDDDDNTIQISSDDLDDETEDEA